ncbi:MAG: hypothetical protein ABW200_19360, partial [Hyphomicrobiaceae bacterium]
TGGGTGGTVGPAPVSLGTLTFSGSLQIGTVASGSINGATAGSTITSNVPGISVNSGARTYAGTPTGSAGTIANALVETLIGASNSPKNSSATVAASGAVAGSAPTNLTATGVTPTIRYHIPSGSSVSTTTVNGAQVATNVTDMQGLADASNVSGTGPVVLTDEVGRKVLSFTEGTSGTYSSGVNGPNLLQIADAFTASQRAVTTFMVVRVHKQNQSKCSFFSLGKAGASPPNTGNASLNMGFSSNAAPYLFGCSVSAVTDATNGAKIIPGCQLQVIGVVSRAGAAGTNTGQRLYINSDFAAVAQTTAALTGTGGTIGSYAFAPGTTDWFDLYEMVTVAGTVTDTQADAIAAAMVANWGITAVDSTFLLEGDSITDGITGSGAGAGLGVDSRNSLGMQLTKPGASLIPANYRVINRGISGAKVADLVSRRDATNPMSAAKSPNKNVMAFQIGRNDFSAGGGSVTGAAEYASAVALMNTTTTGYLQRGWDCVPVLPIAESSATQAQVADYWAALRNTAQLKADTLSGTGQTYDGKVRALDLAAVSVGGTLIFGSTTAAANVAYYQGDATHPNRSGGTPAMATGGDTPTNGYGAVRGL